MISVKNNKGALMNLSGTFVAIENLDRAIETYSELKPGPAYIDCAYTHGIAQIQLSRETFIVALRTQRASLVSYLASLGIDYDIEAPVEKEDAAVATLDERIEKLLHMNYKIAAIKLYREETGSTLMEAKTHVENLEMQLLQENKL